MIFSNGNSHTAHEGEREGDLPIYIEYSIEYLLEQTITIFVQQISEHLFEFVQRNNGNLCIISN